MTEGRGAAEGKLPRGASKVVFNFVQHMVVDATHVFFTEGVAEGQLWRVEHNGQKMRPVAKVGSGVSDLEMDATHLYWVDENAGMVFRVSKKGGTPQVLAMDQPRPNSLALDADSVYWTNLGLIEVDGDETVYKEHGSVVKAAKDGSGFTLLAGDQSMPGSIALDADQVYWLTCKSCDPDDYLERDRLHSVAKSGGKSRLIRKGPVTTVIANDKHLFCLEGEHRVTRMDKRGRKRLDLVSLKRLTIERLVLEGDTLFYSAGGQGMDEYETVKKIVKVLTDGEEQTVLLEGKDASHLILDRLAAGTSSVFLSSKTFGLIRLPR